LRGGFEKEKTGKFEGIFSKKLLKFEKTKKERKIGGFGYRKKVSID
jgi:hypothetical protein